MERLLAKYMKVTNQKMIDIYLDKDLVQRPGDLKTLLAYSLDEVEEEFFVDFLKMFKPKFYEDKNKLFYAKRDIEELLSTNYPNYQFTDEEKDEIIKFKITCFLNTMDPQNPIFAYEFFTNHNFEKLVIGKEVGYLNFVGEKALDEEAKAKLNKSLNNYIQEIVKEKKL